MTDEEKAECEKLISIIMRSKLDPETVRNLIRTSFEAGINFQKVKAEKLVDVLILMTDGHRMPFSAQDYALTVNTLAHQALAEYRQGTEG